MKYRHTIAALNLLSIGMAMGLADTAMAQDAAQDSQSSSGLTDIVVTATRRETNVQDTPLAITAISGASLQDRGITDPRQLSGLAPSLNVDQGLGNGSTHVSIRGQAATGFGLDANSPAGIYLDDVFQPYQFGLGTQIFDLNRVEVLRGPQGTLFGKNTTAGSVNYYSQAPSRQDGGYLTVDGNGGDFTRFSAEGALNKVLSSTLAARGSFRIEHQNPYVDNLFGGSKLGQHSNYAGRLQLQWTPTSDTTVNLKVFGLKSTGDAPVYIAKGYYGDPCAAGQGPYFNCDSTRTSAQFPTGTPTPLSTNSRSVYTERPTFENFDNYGATLKIDHKFNDFVLTSISNGQKGHYGVGTNDDGTAGDFFHSKQFSETWQVSQELRVATPASAPLRAILGVYGQQDEIKTDQFSISSDLDPALDPAATAFEFTGLNKWNTKTTTFAGFGSLTYDVTKAFSVTGGLRYTYERKEADLRTLSNFGFGGADITERYFDYDYALSQFNPASDTLVIFNRRKAWKKLTWDITANYKPTDQSMIYAKVSRGFRSGGFFSAPAGSGSAFVALEPEIVTSYEGGFKTEWFDRVLRINAAGYYTEYKDMQVQQANQSGAGVGFTNGSGRIKGAELEVDLAPSRGLLISSSLAYTDAKYTKYNTFVNTLPVSLSGNTFPYAPKWSANFAVNYDVPVSDTYKVSLNTTWNYRSEIFFSPANDRIVGDAERFMGNVRIGYGPEDDSWTLTAYVNNVLNEDSAAFGFSQTFIVPTVYAPKRTWGLRGNYRF